MYIHEQQADNQIHRYKIVDLENIGQEEKKKYDQLHQVNKSLENQLIGNQEAFDRAQQLRESEIAVSKEKLKKFNLKVIKKH